MAAAEDLQAARAADAQQATYFREELAARRQLLLGDIEKRRALLEHLNVNVYNEIRHAMHSEEADVRYLDHLIAGLDRRFGTETAKGPSR